MGDVTTGCLTREELAESLIFYRRRLTEKLAVALIEAVALTEKGPHTDGSWVNVPATAEDLANNITERLAARETGSPDGYK